MKVLLIKDVYKLGFAGEVKKVADGYGRNYLLPQGLAVLATAGAVKQADRIRETAAVRRAELNEEMGSVAEQIAGLQLTFPARAGETGKLYGSVTTRMVAEAIKAETGLDITAKQIDAQPIRMLGQHELDVRLTMDLVPQISVVVYREGETVEAMLAEVLAQAELAAMEEEMDEFAAEAPDMAAVVEQPSIFDEVIELEEAPVAEILVEAEEKEAAAEDEVEEASVAEAAVETEEKEAAAVDEVEEAPVAEVVQEDEDPLSGPEDGASDEPGETADADKA